MCTRLGNITNGGQVVRVTSCTYTAFIDMFDLEAVEAEKCRKVGLWLQLLELNVVLWQVGVIPIGHLGITIADLPH
jgi:hypothetical protein